MAAGSSATTARSRHTLAGSNYYRILQIEPDAELEVIDAVYRALARKYHPDVNRDSSAQERIREINEAYAVLHDAAQRGEYDGQLLRSAAPFHGSLPTTPGAAGVGSPATAARGAGAGTGRSHAPSHAPLQPDRPIDLLMALWRDYRQRAAAARRATVAGKQADGASDTAARNASAATAGAPARRSLPRGLPLLFGATLVALIAASGVLIRDRVGVRGETIQYWRAAAIARGPVEAARLRFVTAVPPGEGFQTVAGNPAAAGAASELLVALEAAAAGLKRSGRVPAAAESFHFGQLEDWNEERQIRRAMRDALVSRNGDLWAQATAQELIWLGSQRHLETEAGAWQLAALAAAR